MKKRNRTLSERLKGKRIEKMTSALMKAACFQALEDVTQEINMIMYMISPGDEPKECWMDTILKAVNIYGKRDTNKLRDLLKKHRDNLDGVLKILDSVSEEPTAYQIRQIQKDEQTLAREYEESNMPIVYKRIAEIETLLDEDKKRIAAAGETLDFVFEKE